MVALASVVSRPALDVPTKGGLVNGCSRRSSQWAAGSTGYWVAALVRTSFPVHSVTSKRGDHESLARALPPDSVARAAKPLDRV